MILLLSVAYASDINKTETSSKGDTQNTISQNNTNLIVQNKENNNSNILTKQVTSSNTKTANQQNTTIKTNKIYVNSKVNTLKQDGSSKNPYASIQEAVKKASKNGQNIIYLSEGNHKLTQSITITKTIFIIGKGKYKTNITCDSNQAFRISKNSNLTLQKLTIQNANYSQGGAILASENSKLVIKDCAFKKNHANNGAVIFTSGQKVQANITNSNFESNTAVRFGAALQLGGYNSVYRITNCIFKSNVLTDTDYTHSTGGAAIYASSYSKVYVKQSVFKNNIALWGNAILNGNHATIKITYSNFTNNIAKKSVNDTYQTKGGAVAIGSGYAEIGYCNFISNKADIGGAISINSGESSYIYSSTFQKNVGYYQAGAINNYGTLKLKNNTFLKNSAKYCGGAIIDKGINEVLIDKCVFKDNKVETSKLENYQYKLSPQGGAISIIYGSPEFVIKNSIFDHNSAYYGGAIYSNNEVKWVSITNTLFRNNTACFGGAVLMSGETTLTMKNSTFDYNRALRKAGAIYINSTVQGNFYSTIFRNNVVNTTRDGDGGVIYVNKYARLSFNYCNFEKNTANLKGGVICAMSTVNINIAGSNITKNKATTGSVIYINNSNNYKSSKSQIILDTSSFVNNNGNYVLYSVKTYANTYNYNLIRTCWFGSNVIPKKTINNFKIISYDLLTINLNSEAINTNWNKPEVIITINRTLNKDKDLILSTAFINDGTKIRYTDAFLPTRTFTITENNKKATEKEIYVYYHLNMKLNTITIKFDYQKITIKIVN